jgi:branched-subunit amino acid transport protein
MIGGAGLATLCARALFSMLPRSWELPPGVQALLEDVPVAVFAALAMPGLLGEGAFAPSPSSGKVLASAVGAYLAWKTRHVWLALLVGIGVFWLDVWVI